MAVIWCTYIFPCWNTIVFSFFFDSLKFACWINTHCYIIYFMSLTSEKLIQLFFMLYICKPKLCINLLNDTKFLQISTTFLWALTLPTLNTFSNVQLRLKFVFYFMILFISLNKILTLIMFHKFFKSWAMFWLVSLLLSFSFTL